MTTITIDRNRRTSERRGQAGLDYPEREGGKPKVNDKGDTLKVVQITDRTRARNRDNVVAQKVKIVERIDTVYIQKDSVNVEDKKIGLSASTDGSSKKSGLSELFLCHDSGKPKRAWSLRSLLHRFLTYVKWITALVCAVVVLVVVIRLKC